MPYISNLHEGDRVTIQVQGQTRYARLIYVQMDGTAVLEAEDEGGRPAFRLFAPATDLSVVGH
jgi:hypothetical protein